MTGEGGSGTGRGRPSKVLALIEKYDLEGLGDELERKWTKTGPDRRSLRDLADDFNVAVLERALSDASVQTLSGEVENLYRLLTGDEASTGDRTRARRRLERDGVDVDALYEEFVSYQAIRTYLTSHRGATYESADVDLIERTQSTVQQLQSRLVTVAESKFDRLDESGDIDVGSPGVIVDLRGVCEDCGHQFALDELTTGVECDCHRS